MSDISRQLKHLTKIGARVTCIVLEGSYDRNPSTAWSCHIAFECDGAKLETHRTASTCDDAVRYAYDDFTYIIKHGFGASALETN